MENTDNKNLSLPQRNWFLICVVVAIISPLAVHFLQASAHKESYKQSIDIKTQSDSSKVNDSSYKVASPPNNTGGDKKADSASH